MTYRAEMTRAPRSLADALRARTDDQLAILFTARPDLVSPVPADLAAVAARAGTRASVHRALAGLDLPTVQVATVLTVLPAPVGLGELARACGGSTARVRPALQRLLDQALAFGSPRAAQPVRVLAELLGPHPAGLGPPLAELLTGAPARLAAVCAAWGVPADPAQLAAALADRLDVLLDGAPSGCADLLATLDRSGPVGSVNSARRDLNLDERSPVDWLLARGFVVPIDDAHVVVPREVGIGLRAGVILRLAEPPQPPVSSRSAELVTRMASGAVLEIVRHVGELANHLQHAPIPLLRHGGVSAREVTRLARDLATDPAALTFALVVAAGAGLCAADGDADPHLRLTEAADDWLDAGVGRQWVGLVRGWLAAPWAATLAGSRDARGTLCSVLSAATERDAERRLRHDVLDIVAAAPPGSAHEPTLLTAELRHAAPRGPVAAALAATRAVADSDDQRVDLVETVAAEAHTLGLLAFDTLADFAALLLAGDPAGAAEAVDALLPPAVTTVVVQADLTAVAPGILTRASQTLMDLAADVESRGAATVFRFTPASILRALDAGKDAATLLSELAEISAGPLPQPLEYLVTDTARRHARVRVGSAGSYLCSDDPAALTELLAAPRLAGQGWRRLAPTVVAAPTDPARTLQLARLAGVAAVAEAADGTLVLTAATQHRRAPAREHPGRGEPPRPSSTQLAELIGSLRRRDQADNRDEGTARSSADLVPPASATRPSSLETSLARLHAATAEGGRVWLTYSDGVGERQTLLVEPLTVDGGRARVVETATGQVRSIAAHRLLGVHLAG